MNKITIIALILFTLCSGKSYSQKKQFLPEDIKTEKIIFLELTGTTWPEGVEPQNATEKHLKRQVEQRNKNIPIFNKRLREMAEKYPFKYVVAKRSEIPKYQAEGFKYVLDCKFYQCIDNGESFYGAGKYNNLPYTNILRLEELNSKNAYSLYEFDLNGLYSPTIYLSFFNREANKLLKN